MQLTRSAKPIMRALQTAQQRGIMPTRLGSAKIAQFLKGLWQQAFFSARTNNATYVSHMKELVDRYIAGGYNSDLGQLRVEAREMLQQLGYNPATGFPEDFGHIPEAKEGSLQDLSSDKRLNLIFETNADLARGLTQQAQGLDRIYNFPAWELGRITAKRVPRGSPGSNTTGWEERFLQVCTAEEKAVYESTGRMMALKTSETWAKLGSRENFSDALDVDHPPFAFGSGEGWIKEVDHAECVGVGLIGAQQRISPENGQKMTERGESIGFTPPAKSTEPTYTVKDVPKSIDKQTLIGLLDQLNKGGKKVSVDSLRAAVQSQLSKHQASNDARHLRAAFIGTLLMQQAA